MRTAVEGDRSLGERGILGFFVVEGTKKTNNNKGGMWRTILSWLREAEKKNKEVTG